MLKIKNLAELKTKVGHTFEPSEWVTIDQDMINRFADATGDHQWIHIDEERTKKESPFGTTIAHGFLTLSLLPKFSYTLYEVESVRMGVNYGTDKVRFTNAVPSGSEVRMVATLSKVEDNAHGGVKVFMMCVFEIKGKDKPACVAEQISLLFE